MSKVKYNASRHIQVIKVDSPYFSLVKSGVCKEGAYIISKIGMFYNEVDYLEGVNILADGICKDSKYCDAPYYKVVDKSTADKIIAEIIGSKSKELGAKLELELAKAEIEALKKTNAELEKTSKTTSSK